MKLPLIVGFISLALLSYVSSHSFPMSSKPRITLSGLPQIQSYHIHCQFINGDKNEIAKAISFRTNFVNHFNLTNVEACKDLFDDIRLCMFGKKISSRILKL